MTNQSIPQKPKEEPKTELKSEKPKAEKPQAESVQEADVKPQEKPIEEPKSDSENIKEKPKKTAPSGKFKDLIEKIEKLSALELSELVKELEKRFGVSATPAMVAPTAADAADQAAAKPEEEKALVNVVITAPGTQKINVIKAIREISELGLKEAKDLVDASAEEPKEIKKEIKREEAEEIKKKLEAAGAKIELK